MVCVVFEETPLKLSEFGWTPFYAEPFESLRARGFVPARVARRERGAWEVWIEAGALFVTHAKSGLDPVVGDWVALRPELNSIEALIPRKSALVRRAAGEDAETQALAANVDTAMVVMGLDGDFNLRRLERYAAMIRASGVRGVVLLNKRDLCPESAQKHAQTSHFLTDFDVFLVSALEDDIPGLIGAICGRGETAALLGSSGAGKSTITNRLLGFEQQATNEVREHDSRGRHTTTARRIVALPQGWLLVDMPGLREVGLVQGGSALDEVFGEITELAGACRFRDCKHSGEPGCAVHGNVDPKRLESWHKLVRETRSPEERRREEKRIHRAMKTFYRVRGRGNEDG